MKQLFFTIAAVAALASCAKEAPVASQSALQDSDEISFLVENDLGVSVETRASAVESLNSFNVLAENTVSSEQLWSIETTKNGSNYNTGKFWPSVDGKYAFYASNVTLAYNAAGTTVSPSDNDIDVVVAYSAYSAGNYRKVVPLTFDHIYARIGKVEINAPESYSIEVKSVSTEIVKGGTYNVKTSVWSSKGSEAAQTLSVGANDVYAVPGNIVVTVTYVLTKGDFSKEFTKSGSISLTQGKVNNITASPSLSSDEGASDIVFTVSLTPWGSEDHSITLN